MSFAQTKRCRAAKRTDLLVHGMLERSEWDSKYPTYFPFELIQSIHDFCYRLYSDWINRPITIQMVSPSSTDLEDDCYLSGCTLKCWHNGNESHFQTDTENDTDPYCIAFSNDPERKCTHKSMVWRMYRVDGNGNGNDDGFIIRPVDVDISENGWIQAKTPYFGRDGLDSKRNAVPLQLVKIGGCGIDEYHIQCVDDGQYLSVHIQMDDDEDEDRIVHFQGDHTKSVRVRLKQYNRCYLDRWRLDLDTGSQIWYRDDDSYGWCAAKVISTRKRKHFEKEILLQININRGYFSEMCYEYVPIRSTHICHEGCKDMDHDHNYFEWWCPSEMEPDFWCPSENENEFEMGLWWTRKGANRDLQENRRNHLCNEHTIYMKDDRHSRKLKSRERQKAKRRKQREYRRWNGKDCDKRIGRKMKKYGKQMY